MQLSLNKHPDLSDVPLVMDFAKTDTQRRILELAFTAQLWGRPYVAPPGLPPERARALRNGFAAALADPALLAEADKLGYDVKLLAGEEMARLIAELYAAPPEIVRATRAAFRGDKM